MANQKDSVEHKFPFLLTQETLRMLMVGDIVEIIFDNPAKQGKCHRLCGATFQRIVMGIDIPTSTSFRAGREKLMPSIQVNPVSSGDDPDHFYIRSKRKWGGPGGETNCTINVIGRLCNIPLNTLLQVARHQYLPSTLD